MSAWQPIETVPKGVFVLGFWSGGGHMGVVEYSEAGEYWREALGEVSEPTHWMPLPEPPKSP